MMILRFNMQLAKDILKTFIEINSGNSNTPITYFLYSI